MLSVRCRTDADDEKSNTVDADNADDVNESSSSPTANAAAANDDDDGGATSTKSFSKRLHGIDVDNKDCVCEPDRTER